VCVLPELRDKDCVVTHCYTNRYLQIVRLNCVPQDLKESFNYGFYCPSAGGKAGKFLDEERPLKDYPLAGPVGFLQVSCSYICVRMLLVHCFLKKDTDVGHYRLDVRQPILIIFGRNVAERE